MIELISFNSILEPFLVMVFIFFFAWLISRFVPFYKETVLVEERGRYEALDGLRGFLAFGVFFQHVVTNYTYITTGEWLITEYSIYRHFGGEAVILFFMITSFLYWSKAIVNNGEMNVLKLYRSRFYRLAPMYLFSAGVITTIALFATNFNIPSITVFAKDIFSWLTLGLGTTLSTNGFNIVPINAGIHWTLHFEWFFYLLLPVLAISLQNKTVRFINLPILFFALSSSHWGYWAIFLFGIASAHIVKKWQTVNMLKHKWVGILPIIGFFIVYKIQYEPYSVLQYFVTMGIFLCFVYGNDIFGLLKTLSARFLGTISYSIYLLHGIVLSGVLQSVNHFHPIISLSAFSFWLVVLVAGLITLVLSSITYRYIEYPFLRKMHPKKLDETPIQIIERVI